MLRSSFLYRLLRLAAINVAILVALWMITLIAIAVGTDVVHAGKSLRAKEVDPRAALPNYPDHEYAASIYRDQNSATRVFFPFIEWRHKPLKTRTQNVDSRGLRTHTVGLDNDPDATTIGFFGGSTMWGYGVDDNNTIPALFDAITTKYKVTNYGEPGWTSRQNLEMLINLIMQGDPPKVVVFYDGYNDVGVLCDRAVARDVNSTTMDGRLRELIRSGRSSGGGVYQDLILPVLRVIRTTKETTAIDRVCAKDPAEAEKVANAMVRTWSIAARLVEDYGGHFYGFVQPSIFTGHPRSDYVPPDADANWKSRDELRPDFDAVYPLLRQKLAQTRINWADLSNALDGDGYFYTDSCHVTGNGNAIIAKLIRDRITTN